MRYFLIILLLPLHLFSQTVHVSDGKIKYKGTVTARGLSKDSIYSLLASSFSNAQTSNDEKKIVSQGSFRLNSSTYNTIRTIHYTLKLEPGEGQYHYTISDVYLVTRERGERTDTTSSGDMLKGLEVSGKRAMLTERGLDEIDMMFQKEIARLTTLPSYKQK